ncbi:hypothetical protein D3C87_1694660 [compost metagenome]
MLLPFRAKCLLFGFAFAGDYRKFVFLRFQVFVSFIQDRFRTVCVFFDESDAGSGFVNLLVGQLHVELLQFYFFGDGVVFAVVANVHLLIFVFLDQFFPFFLCIFEIVNFCVQIGNFRFKFS